MKKSILASAILSAIALAACSPNNESKNTMTDTPVSESTISENVLLKPSPLPYQAPEFDKIKIEHYEPAFEQGMQAHSEEIDTIATNGDTPTFDNTILALEQSGELLNRVATVFFNLSSIVSNDEIQRIEAEMVASSHCSQ